MFFHCAKMFSFGKYFFKYANSVLKHATFVLKHVSNVLNVAFDLEIDIFGSNKLLFTLHLHEKTQTCFRL